MFAQLVPHDEEMARRYGTSGGNPNLNALGVFLTKEARMSRSRSSSSNCTVGQILKTISEPPVITTWTITLVLSLSELTWSISEYAWSRTSHASGALSICTKKLAQASEAQTIDGRDKERRKQQSSRFWAWGVKLPTSCYLDKWKLEDDHGQHERHGEVISQATHA